MIAERLDDRFALLTGGSRAALQRHQTLRTLIDWSYNLLSGDAQRLLRYLSVFAGGWRVDAAEAIGQSEHAIATLAELVDKSLVHTFESGSWHRYAMLETIRQYAAEKLKEAGENDDAYERMASYLRTLAASRGANRAAMHAEFAGELDNVRTCMSWARAHANPEHHLRMVLSLGLSVTNSCRLAEPLAWLSEALDRATEALMSLRLNGMISELGLMTFSGYHLTHWKPRVHDPIEAARILGDTALIFEVLFWMGAVAWQQGDYARVIALYEQGLALSQSLKSNSDTYPTLGIVQPLDQVIASFTWGIGLVKMQLGDIASARVCFQTCVQIGMDSNSGNGNQLFLGLSGCAWLDAELAAVWAEQALPRLRKRENKTPLAYALQAYAQALIIRGDTDQSLAILQESLTIWRDLGLTWESSSGSAQTLMDLGQVEWLRGDAHAARAWYELSLAEYAQVGDRERIARLQIYIGLTHLVQGSQELAAQHFAVGLDVYRELGQPAGLALCLAAYARLAESRNQLDRSALLYGAASTCTQLELMSASVLWPASAVVFQREIASAHARHSHLPSTHAWQDGKRLTLMQALTDIHDLTEI
jgi:tetratricopeptide (TPR) repeat protein